MPPSPVIPDAGVYGAETAAATNAYNQAVASAQAQRNALYHSYGLNQRGAVDPNNPGGEYQMLLKQQGDQFMGDSQDAESRGLGRGGLANQAESNDRAGDVGQDFQFQSRVAGAGSDYQNSLQDAFSNRDSATTAAYNDALQTALKNMLNSMGSGDYTAPGTGTTVPNGSAGDGSDRPTERVPIRRPRHIGHPGHLHARPHPRRRR